MNTVYAVYVGGATKELKVSLSESVARSSVRKTIHTHFRHTFSIVICWLSGAPASHLCLKYKQICFV